MTTTKNTEQPQIGNKPLWKCSPDELRKYCADKGIKLQDGLRQYQLANIVKEHLAALPQPKENGLSREQAQKMIDERNARAKKMVMPSGIVTKEDKKKEKAEKKKEQAPANLKELKERTDIKAILTADVFKKEMIQSLGKLGLDRFTIADLCETNQGHVWNVLNEKKDSTAE